MPTFVYMTSCDGCGYCVDICPSDIMHIDTTSRRAYNIEPNMCWECYSCVKACPQNAIDCPRLRRFRPLGPQRPRAQGRGEGQPFHGRSSSGTASEKNFVSPIRTTPWGSIKSPSDYEAPSPEAMNSQELAHEPEALNIDKLPTLSPDRIQCRSWSLMGLFSRRKTVFVDSDVLVIGGGMAGCGATYESRLLGARPQGRLSSRRPTLSAVAPSPKASMRSTATWACSGTRTNPRTMSATPATTSWVWCARTSATTSPGTSTPRCTSSRSGVCRIMKDPETGRYLREGKWQIMIHGESYKPIVAEAARKAATEGLQQDHGHPPADGHRDEAQPGRRRRRVQRPQRGILRLPLKGRHRVRRWRVAHLQAPRGRRRDGADLVRPLEQRISVCASHPRRAPK